MVDTTTLVLTTLRDAARLTSIPYLQQAAGLALGIVTTIQGARDNKSAFQRLADDACGLVYTVILSMRGAPDHAAPNVSKDLLDNLRELVGTLSQVERFAKKHASQHIFMGIIRNGSDVGRIQEYRESLRQSLDLFGLRSTITIQDNIARLASQQEVISELRRLTARDERRTSVQNRIDAEPAGNESLARGPEIQRAEGISREYRGPPSRETTGSDLQQTKRIYHAPNHISQRPTNPFRIQHVSRPHTQLNPMMVRESRSLATQDDEQHAIEQTRTDVEPASRNKSLAEELKANEAERAEGINPEHHDHPRREAGSKVLQTHENYHASSHIQRPTNPFRTQHFTSLNPQPNPTMMSTACPCHDDPFLPHIPSSSGHVKFEGDQPTTKVRQTHHSHPFLPHIQSSSGHFEFTSIESNPTTTDSPIRAQEM